MSSFGEQEFNQACIDDRHDVIDIMLADGYIPTTHDLVIACQKGNQLLVTKLLSYDLDFQEGFRKAVEKGHFHLLDHLYTRIDVNKPDALGYTVIYIATDVRVVQWLLDMGAQQTADRHGYTPLHIACINNCVNKVEPLLQHTKHTHFPNIHGNIPLHLACMFGCIEVVKLLLQHMSDQEIQIRNNNGKTPIDIAKIIGHMNIVQLLEN